MRLSLRFVIPLLAVLTAVAYAVLPLVDQWTLRWFVRDLDIRSALIANALQEPLPETCDRRLQDARLLQNLDPPRQHRRRDCRMAEKRCNRNATA